MSRQVHTWRAYAAIFMFHSTCSVRTRHYPLLAATYAQVVLSTAKSHLLTFINDEHKNFRHVLPIVHLAGRAKKSAPKSAASQWQLKQQDFRAVIHRVLTKAPRSGSNADEMRRPKTSLDHLDRWRHPLWKAGPQRTRHPVNMKITSKRGPYLSGFRHPAFAPCTLPQKPLLPLRVQAKRAAWCGRFMSKSPALAARLALERQVVTCAKKKIFFF